MANLHNFDFPPKVSPREIVESDLQNKLYFEMWFNPLKVNGGPAPGKDPTRGEAAETLSAILERGNKADPALIDLFKDASKQRDELARLMSQQKELAPAPAPQLDLLAISLA